MASGDLQTKGQQQAPPRTPPARLARRTTTDGSRQQKAPQPTWARQPQLPLVKGGAHTAGENPGNAANTNTQLGAVAAASDNQAGNGNQGPPPRRGELASQLASPRLAPAWRAGIKPAAEPAQTNGSRQQAQPPCQPPGDPTGTLAARIGIKQSRHQGLGPCVRLEPAGNSSGRGGFAIGLALLAPEPQAVGTPGARPDPPANISRFGAQVKRNAGAPRQAESPSQRSPPSRQDH